MEMSAKGRRRSGISVWLRAFDKVSVAEVMNAEVQMMWRDQAHQREFLLIISAAVPMVPTMD
jgi:hypothetical protein